MIIRSFRQESEYLAGGIFHGQGFTGIRKIHEDGSTVQSGSTEFYCAGNRKIMECKTAIHCSTKKSKGITWRDLKFSGKFIRDQSFSFVCRKMTNYQRLPEVKTILFN